MQNNNATHWLISKTQNNDAVRYANFAAELQSDAYIHQKEKNPRTLFESIYLSLRVTSNPEIK